MSREDRFYADLDYVDDQDEYYEELEEEASRKSNRRVAKPTMKVDGMDSVRLIDYLQRTRYLREKK